MGANIIKSYYCDNFEGLLQLVSSIVVAGGRSFRSRSLTLAYKAIAGGARGLDMGRNIFRVNIN